MTPDDPLDVMAGSGFPFCVDRAKIHVEYNTYQDSSATAFELSGPNIDQITTTMATLPS